MVFTKCKMNILFTIGSYDSFGGTERITTVLANALAGEGVVVIAAFRGECRPEKFGLSSKVFCENLEGNSAENLRAALLRYKIDVVINQWCLPFYVTRTINKARRGLAVKLISALHGLPDKSKKVIVAEDAVKKSRGISRLFARARLYATHLAIKASIRYVYRKSDAYVVLSEGFITVFKEYTGLKCLSRLYAIGNPITIKVDLPSPELANKKKQIRYVGRMDKENKRVNRIIEAWEAVCGDYPDWNLLLVGGGPHLADLERYVEEHAVPRVAFTGFLADDPIEQYKESSIFMLTSDLEGFGLVLVEAMSYGVVPVVYGSYVAVHDIVTDGKDGFITAMPYSQAETVAKMKMLMDDNSLMRRMSAAAIKKANRFSLESTMDKWRGLLRKVAEVRTRK